jgi:cyclopropane fatty-acyl-phospholipid synthase-like methyltransferase
MHVHADVLRCCCVLLLPCSYWDCPDAHLPVLQDLPYQAAWERALQAAAPLLQDAVVLDVGCGLGTLAMAAAQVCV